jgi:prepilin-type N-terminal cleavage/methylation domain-containing protein
MRINKHAAFSLIELLVVMAIIAVLLGLAAFGIATAQRNQRNTQRRQVVSNIAVAMTDYQIEFKKFPTKSDFSVQGDNIILSSPSNQVFSKIKADGPGKPTSNINSVDANSAFYCYKLSSGSGYLLAVKLEGNLPGSINYYNGSTDTGVKVENECPNNSLF